MKVAEPLSDEETEFARKDGDRPSRVLARRALIISAILSLAGSVLGAISILHGTVSGIETILVLSGLVFASGTLATLLVWRNIALQAVATVSTAYFAIYLCAGTIIAVFGPAPHFNFFIYLLWFFPLMVFNKLVNAPATGRLLAKSLMLAPLLIICCLFPRLLAIFETGLLFVLAIWCFSYVCFGLMFDTVTRYREEYIVERERAESLKVESAVLESISDCFISLDSEMRLVYLNDAACTEFAVERCVALNDTIANAIPGVFSRSIMTELQAASGNCLASMFEARNEKQDRWYEMRCFPRRGGMSVYFRNITESILSRHQLAEAHSSLREQAELLDKAQDAIFVQDMDNRVLYWNKSAERFYGWTAKEVTGRPMGEIFPEPVADMEKCVASVLQYGEWSGELSQRHREGNTLIVESRWTLVRGEDGKPKSILSINTDITNRKEAEAKVRHLAFHDVLTGLPNRLLLRECMDAALATAGRQGNMGALLFIDLDDFKTLNDTLGHDTGDLLLQQVAVRLTSCVRATDTVARLGGDEFVVMLEALSDDARIAAAQAKAIGDQILGAFIDPYVLGSYEYSSTASVGITMFPGWSDTVDDLLKRADMAMYRAKAQGRNAMCFFDPAMQSLVASRAALKADLRRAVQDQEFELHYQPQVDGYGHVTGAEALLRWPHPRGGMVPPNEFIPLAEEAGLIVEMGGWVLEAACSQLAKWAKRPEMETLSIAVNVSVRQFKSCPTPDEPEGARRFQRRMSLKERKADAGD
jgi:diguanylate cyclase (GGDEF)-like protein/PAS domain S-box-containing protein